MTKIHSKTELKEAIRLLEIDKAKKLDLLKEEAHIILESLKPANIIKESIKNVLQSSTVKENARDGLLGLVTGYISKKLLISGGTNNPVKNIFGNIIQFGIAKLVSKNAAEIKIAGKGLLRSLLTKKNQP